LFISGEVFVASFIHTSHSSIGEQPSNLPKYPPHLLFNCGSMRTPWVDSRASMNARNRSNRKSQFCFLVLTGSDQTSDLQLQFTVLWIFSRGLMSIFNFFWTANGSELNRIRLTSIFIKIYLALNYYFRF